MPPITLPRRISLPRRARWRWRALFGLRRQRRRLGVLSDAALRDIGLTRAEAEAEAERPFWDPPAYWWR